MLSALKRSVAAKEIFTLSGATLLSQLISFSLYPILTRLYDPSELGALALFLAIVSVLAVLAPFQIDQIVLFSSRDEDISVATTSLFFIIFSFTSIAWILLLTLKTLAFATIQQIDWWVLCLFPLFLLPAAFLRYFQSAAVREKAFHSIALSGSGSLIGASILKVLFGALQANLVSLIFSELIYYWSNFLSLCIFARKKIKKYFKRTRFKEIGPYLLSQKSFILSAQVASLFNATNAYLPVHFVAFIYNSEQVGYFAFALGLVAALSRNLAQSILQVFSHRFAHYVRSKNNLAAQQVFQKTMMRSLALGIPIILLAFWVVPILFPMVFGETWAPAGLLIPPLMLLFLFNLLSLPSLAALRILERPGLTLCAEMSVTAFNILALIWASHTGTILINYLWVVGSLQLFTAFTFSFLTWNIVRRRA